MTTNAFCGSSRCRCSGDDEADEEEDGGGDSEVILAPKEDSITVCLGEGFVGEAEVAAAAAELEAVVSTG